MKIKQLFHFVLACSLMLTAAACTDEVVTNEGNGTDSTDVPEGMQALTLKVGGITGGSVTKASVIAKPEEIAVNDMTIYVFKYDPALGDDDTDDNNYTYLDYWTYSNADPALTGYTANNRQAHTFTLGGSGQYRTATIYIPKEAGKVKCYVVTGNPVLCYLNGENRRTTYFYQPNRGEDTWLPSGVGISKESLGSSSKPDGDHIFHWDIYRYLSSSIHPFTGKTLSEIKKANAGSNKYVEGVTSEIPAAYWDTPLSMSGESNTLDIDGQSGNSSTIDATLRRHVARLDIINNSLPIEQILIDNIPIVTLSMEGGELPNLNTEQTGEIMGSSSTPAEGAPAASFNDFPLYDHTTAADEAYFKAITRYVYPNVPKELDAAGTYIPFITVRMKDMTSYILPLQSKNEDGSFTRIDLQANHRYSLVINKLGENFVDYNIIIEDWQAGADFSVHLGEDVTSEQINYMPAITEKVAYGAENATFINKELNSLLIANENADGNKTDPKWQFYTSATLEKINIIECTSPGGIASGKLISTTDNGHYSSAKEGDPDNPKRKHTQTLSSRLTYSTRWLALQNPYNITNYSMVKAEYAVNDGVPGMCLAMLNETNEYETTDAETLTVPFTPGSYYTEWPATGREGYDSDKATTNANRLPAKQITTTLLFLAQLTESTPDQGLDMTSLEHGIKKHTLTDTKGTYTYYLASNGNSDLPCTIASITYDFTNKQQAEGRAVDDSNPDPIYYELMMWERVLGNDGQYYIKITACCGPDLAGFTPTSYEGLRTLIRNIENGKNTAYGSLTRYFPEGNYWLKDPAMSDDSQCLFSFDYRTFGKKVTEAGATGYIRKVKDTSNSKP
ncbi:MAG: hypothetical protein ACK5N4_11635 [Parabacteroides gordonii]|uniref:hypothetical protein n=1 Tax=Parabacteroides gordonii TaxID=574930 RepID=UPI003A8BA3D5